MIVSPFSPHGSLLFPGEMTSIYRSRLALALAFSLLGTASAAAHDDDPKILDRQAPYQGLGFRPGAYVSGGSLAGAGNVQGTGLGGVILSTLSSGHMSYESQGMELLSWMPLSTLGGGAFSGNDCWGYVSGSGREYAIIGTSSGTSFVEITTPSDPVLVQFIAGESSLWRDIKVYQNYAYIVSEGGGGIQVVNLSQIDNGTVNLANTIFSGGTQDSHNVAIDTTSGYLYRCGGGSNLGLRAYSLSNPASPSYQGSWHSRYVHDVQVVTYTSGPNAGRQIAFACSGFGNGSGSTGVTVIDVTNKNNMWVRDQFYYPNAGYSHQAWLTEDQQYLLLNDELDETGQLPTTTHVIDAGSINNLSYAGSFTNGNNAIGHNLYTKGNLVFEANYRSGVRVFDISNLPNATETAFFDTWPGDDKNEFNGLWSVYPYFPSGVVIGSDLERGLFVWHMGDPKVQLDIPGGFPERVDPGGQAVTVQISELSNGDLQQGTERLFYDNGGGIVEVPLVNQGGGSYLANFPAMTCGTNLKWFVGARSTDGILWTLPKEAPYNTFDSTAAVGEIVVFTDDMETDKGWTVGDPTDTATSGVWERGDPIPSPGSTQDDHSPNGTLCWTTGINGDVDNGITTLTSPVFNLSGLSDPIISFWLWFRRDGMAQAVDQCRIEVTNDGSNWVEMERITVVPPEIDGSWDWKVFHVANWVVPTSQVQLRVRVQEDNLDTFVEALVDDVKVSEWTCSGCTSSTANYCSSSQNSSGQAATIFSTGSPEIGLNNFTLEVSGAVPGNLGQFFYGEGTSNTPLAEGTLCVDGGGAGIQRLQPPDQIDAFGSVSRFLDFNAPPANSGPGAILAGSTWYFQFWYRDPSGGPGGSNLSDGLSVSFCP